jgi:regulator of sigma E protease
MDFLLTAVVFVLIFSALVLIHEFGHFIVARKSGIKVEEFGFGLPPRIWGHKRGETLYSINAIPFGGFVKLLGEEGGEAKVLKNKRSFAAKPARTRTLVIVAGVFMNFMLAWLLLTIGFTVGMQPLVLSGDDVLTNIASGVIQVRQGIVVKTVVAGSSAEMAGLKAGDRIVAVSGKEPASAEELKTMLSGKDGKSVTLDIVRDGKSYRSNISPDAKKSLGIVTYDLIYLPRTAVQAVRKGEAAEKAGIKPGDVILALNGKQVYFVEDFREEFGKAREVEMILDDGVNLRTVKYPLDDKGLALVSAVFPGTPAETAGFRKGDVIVSLDGQELLTPEDVVAFTKERAGQAIKYDLLRDGENVTITVAPEASGMIGVGLSRVYSYENADLSVYGTDAPTSVMKIDDVRYPFWVAPIVALEESGRLAGLTAQMFVDVIKSLATTFVVPEGVTGVVGIAQLTHVFIKEGAMPLLRFVALLSLSLAMINIFPIPALDGGKLLFIVVEVVSGRKVNAKFEAVIHMIGFALLMLLILVITYSDIVRVFTA